MKLTRATLAALISLCGSTVALAELPYVRFDRLLPLGGAAGAAVNVEVLGNDLDELKSLLFDHPGLRAEPVAGKERLYCITIAADVPSGTYDVWLVGRFGVSNSRLFAVSRGLADVTEVEPNNAAGQAQAVAVNSAINGSSDQNDQDVFRFSAKKGQRITIQCQAGKLDSLMDSTLSLATAGGARLAANGDYHGRDSFLDIIAQEDGELLVTVNDLSFRGGHPYRLVISDHPQIENVFPRAMQAGVSTDLTLYGRQLGAGAIPSARRIGGLPLEELRLKLAPATDILTLGEFRFTEHPTDYSTLPTAATCTLNGFQLDGAMFEQAGVAALRDHVGSSPTMLLADRPVTLEAEPNDTRDKPQTLSLPALVSGRFDEPGDADWFEISVTEAGSYSFEVYCERIGGRADPYLAIVDEQGNRVTELDDFGHRINAFDGHLRDPSGMVSLAANKKYAVLVQDRYRRGGARYQYVLSIRKPVPDFFVAAIHSQNPGPGATNVWRGGTVFLDVVIHQAEGFNQPITITAENLPAGLHAAATTVGVGTHGTFVLWADADAPEFTGFINLVATGKRTGPGGEETIRRAVRPYCRVWTDAGMNSSRPMRRLPVAIRDKAPYVLRFEPDTLQAEAGQKVDAKLRLTRYWPDCQDKVAVLPLTFPGNFKMSNLDLSGVQTELTVPIEIQAGTRPGDYTLAVLGQTQVPFHKNPESKDRPNTLVSLPSTPLTIKVIEPPKK